ncbi:hypothetical protein I553_10424 [Mycobacterium xenopi 4042]|uniref:Uncharacterized protein n=1 Tax=Mycobacterium xenopi 4042 TaxID=1299334 RepID=X8C7Q0_MYCXE|nr:hypothetical protein I553_10424 [Mycobacterium xenopi 4042]
MGHRWPATRDHLFGSLAMIGGRSAWCQLRLLAAPVGLSFDDEFMRC